MTTSQKLTHIKARLREIVEKCNQVTDDPWFSIDKSFTKLATENWIEMLEELLNDTESDSHIISLDATNRAYKTITRWESVYGEIKEDGK